MPQASSMSIIKVKNIELITFSVIFVTLAVALPWLAHQFNLAGPTFLPMHLFVLTAGLLFGWRAGLMVGLFTPLVSYLTSGMPLAPVLPQITLEVMAYGFFAGLFREKLKLNIYFSLLLALLAGRLILLTTVWILGTSFLASLTALEKAITLGWPGILIQLALVPMLVIKLKKIFESRSFKAES